MIEKKEVCGDCVYRRSEGACTALPPQVVPVAIVPPKQSIVTGSGQEMPLAVQLAIPGDGLPRWRDFLTRLTPHYIYNIIHPILGEKALFR